MQTNGSRTTNSEQSRRLDAVEKACKTACQFFSDGLLDKLREENFDQSVISEVKSLAKEVLSRVSPKIEAKNMVGLLYTYMSGVVTELVESVSKLASYIALASTSQDLIMAAVKWAAQYALELLFG